jgi:hypothetical protein
MHSMRKASRVRDTAHAGTTVIDAVHPAVDIVVRVKLQDPDFRVVFGELQAEGIIVRSRYI